MSCVELDSLTRTELIGECCLGILDTDTHRIIIRLGKRTREKLIPHIRRNKIHHIIKDNPLQVDHRITPVEFQKPRSGFQFPTPKVS
ncbi:MAG: hypothetical protein BWY82_02370 [Verrucomicrobia bacterium ADurb.Bin474]|nr:MAG: hypothetical protein BWY82_02370 [Verrucomicrobia bacterium ADurb.Bin474]